MNELYTCILHEYLLFTKAIICHVIPCIVAKGLHKDRSHGKYKKKTLIHQYQYEFKLVTIKIMLQGKEVILRRKL